MKPFPRNKTWDQFVEDMKEADVWYNVLDSPEEGEILDYMFEIMAWAKENGFWKEEVPNCSEEATSHCKGEGSS